MNGKTGQLWIQHNPCKLWCKTIEETYIYMTDIHSSEIGQARLAERSEA